MSPSERNRYRSTELREASWKALNFMRERFLRNGHAALLPEGKCDVCDEMRRLLFTVAELEEPGP